MSHELMVMLTNILVALLSAGGFWALLEKIPNERRRKRQEAQQHLSEAIDKIDKASEENREAIRSLSTAIQNMMANMAELYDGQKSCRVRIENSEDLSRAFARDRLNYLSNLYIDRGYIPTEDIIPFKLLGQAYIKSGGNSETKTKFEHCIETLPVLDKDDVNRPH